MLNLMLVDDEYIVLKGLEIVLRDQTEVALEIRTAIDAVDAYEKTAGWTPDAIIADINMPEIDGLTMLEQLSDTLPLCRFIIVSGYEENEYLKRALKLHVDDYLLKPVDKLYLIRRLKEIDDEKLRRIKNIHLKCRLMLFKGQFFQTPNLPPGNWRSSSPILIFPCLQRIFPLPKPKKPGGSWTVILNRYLFFPKITGAFFSLIIPLSFRQRKSGKFWPMCCPKIFSVLQMRRRIWKNAHLLTIFFSCIRIHCAICFCQFFRFPPT